jgi:hypothetical protein
MGNAISADLVERQGRSDMTSGDYRIDLPEGYSTFSYCKIGHNYQSHPLLQLDKLEELAIYMHEHEDFVFMNPEIENMNAAFNHTVFDVRENGVSEIFKRLGEQRTWVGINNIHKNAEYNAFLHEILAPYRQLLEEEQGKILDIRSHLFLSTPPSTTPFHFDKQNNIFLQLQGEKQMVLWDPYDKDVVSDRALEEYITANSRDRIKSAYCDELAAKGETFSLVGGEGVYIPSTAPHMVYTGKSEVSNELSISLAVTFYTQLTRYRARILQCNSMLRKLKISSVSPGMPPYRGNSVKAFLGSNYARFKKIAVGYQPPPWSY